MKNKLSNFTTISYGELGDYIGSKANVLVSSDWLNMIIGATEGKKECSKCKEVLTLDSFNNDKRRRFGKRSQCKSCYKEGSDPSVLKKKNVEEVSEKIEYTLTHFES